MNRLQKKCFIASAGTHLLLMLILFVGPAFLARKDKLDNSPLLDFIPLKTVDSAMSGGGNPHGGAPPVRPPEPPPQIREPKQSQAPPEKVPDQPKVPQKHESESLEAKEERKQHLPTVSTKMVTRRSTKAEKQVLKSDSSDNRERELVDARRRTAAAIASAAANIGNDLSGGTSVQLKGPGGGGVPYANFNSAVKTIYTEAWNLPDGADDDATVVTSVTIARDGRVVSAHITRPSGNNIADVSVQLTLDRVKRVVPLPDDSKEDQRTVTIAFNVRAKKAIG